MAGWAVVLTDLSIDGGFVHSVIWDIPGDVAALPEGVEKVAEPAEPAGAKQTLAFDEETRGYRGPCPPEEHTYEFALYALGENPLAGVTLDSTRDELDRGPARGGGPHHAPDRHLHASAGEIADQLAVRATTKARRSSGSIS